MGAKSLATPLDNEKYVVFIVYAYIYITNCIINYY